MKAVALDRGGVGPAGSAQRVGTGGNLAARRRCCALLSGKWRGLFHSPGSATCRCWDGVRSASISKVGSPLWASAMARFRGDRLALAGRGTGLRQHLGRTRGRRKDHRGQQGSERFRHGRRGVAQKSQPLGGGRFAAISRTRRTGPPVRITGEWDHRQRRSVRQSFRLIHALDGRVHSFSHKREREAEETIPTISPIRMLRSFCGRTGDLGGFAGSIT